MSKGGVPQLAQWKWIQLGTMRLCVWSLASQLVLPRAVVEVTDGSSYLVWLWLWCRLEATAPIWPLAWESPYATDATLKSKKKKKKRMSKCVWFNLQPSGLLSRHSCQKGRKTVDTWLSEGFVTLTTLTSGKEWNIINQTNPAAWFCLFFGVLNQNQYDFLKETQGRV